MNVRGLITPNYREVVRLGDHDLTSANEAASTIEIAVAHTRVHEEYVPDIILNDIAIIKLKRQAPISGKSEVKQVQKMPAKNMLNTIVRFADHIRPICLPLDEPLRSADLSGETAVIAGWGATHFQGPQSPVLRHTQVTVVPTAKCARSYKPHYPSQVFDNRIMCAGSVGRDSCQGDSGKRNQTGLRSERFF